jgi:predicted RNA-binding Zn-ribbon protein involved in translation (DUF1610 family)
MVDKWGYTDGRINDAEAELAKFQAVCPHCSEVFELNEEVLKKFFDESAGEDYIKLTCPQCGGTKLFDI